MEAAVHGRGAIGGRAAGWECGGTGSGQLVEVAADGADQFGGTVGCFHDGIGGAGAAV